MKKFLTIAFVLVLFMGAASAQVTSVDSITYESNSDFFDGETFVVDFGVPSEGASTIDVTLTESQLQESFGDQGDVNGQISITTTDQSTTAKYYLGSTGYRNLHYIDVQKLEGSCDTSDDWSSCQAGQDHAQNQCMSLESSNDWQYQVYTDGTYDVYCADRGAKIGEPRSLSTPDTIFKTDFKISGDITRKVTLSNGDAGSGKITNIGDPAVAKLEWYGSLDTGQAVQNADQEIAFYYVYGDNDWRIVNEMNYDAWYTYVHEGGLIDDINSWSNGNMARSSIEDELINRVGPAYEIYINSDVIGGTFSSGTSDAGYYQRELGYDVLYPQFLAYIEGAKFVSIQKYVGDPSITDHPGMTATNPVQIPEGDTKPVSVEFENTASGGTATFNAQASCSTSGFGADVPPATEVSVPAGGTGTITVDMTYTSDMNNPDGQCQVTVQGSSSGATDSSTIYVEGMNINECVPGHDITRTNENNRTEILRCPSDGQKPRELVDTCEKDEEAVPVEDVEGQYKCAETDGPGGGNIFDKISDRVQNTVEDIQQGLTGALNGTWEAVKLVYAGISGLAGVMVYQFITKDFASVAGGFNEKQYSILVPIAVLAAAGTFFLVYQWLKTPVGTIAISLVIVTYMLIKSSTPA